LIAPIGFTALLGEGKQNVYYKLFVICG
jgi:hypothetical protein